MHKRILMTVGVLALAASIASAQAYQRRATMTGNANADEGKCTIEVVVDGAAEVTINGDYATIRNLSGQQPQWRRFECNRVMPSNPGEFRFRGIDGRGSQTLARSAQGGGPAVIRIEDPEGGSHGYTFDIMWRGGVGAMSGSSDRYEDRGYNDRVYDNRQPGAFGVNDSQRACEDAILRQASRRFNTNDIRFLDSDFGGNQGQARGRGRNAAHVGRFEVSRGGFGQSEVYRYSCRVNDRNGRVQAQIQGRDNSRMGDARYGSSDRNSASGPFGATTDNRFAFQSCERAVDERLRRDGYSSVSFGSTGYDTRSTRNDVVLGSARGEARYGSESFDFTCSVNTDGSVRSVDVRRR
jgi:hypothetical protein